MRMVIEVPDDLHSRFKAETTRRGVAQAKIVRDLLADWLSRPNLADIEPSRPVRPAERPANAAEGQKRRDEVLRKLAKGR
jgi:hypothetical protein